MPLGTEVCLSVDDIVLEGDPAVPAPIKKGAGHSSPTDFPRHIYCGQTAGWMQMLLAGVFLTCSSTQNVQF